MPGNSFVGKEGFAAFHKTNNGWRVKRACLIDIEPGKSTTFEVNTVKENNVYSKELVIYGTFKKHFYIGAFCKNPHHYYF